MTPTQQQAIREALENLVRRLDEVHADPHYQSVWQLYMIHGGDYKNGPKYDKELLAARAALDAPEAPQPNTAATEVGASPCPVSALLVEALAVLEQPMSWSHHALVSYVDRVAAFHTKLRAWEQGQP